MDTDEAQEINKQIIERMEKEPENAEYLNVTDEGKYENVGEALDTGATFSTVTGMQAEVEKAQQTYEEIESLEDSHIVSFPKLDKEKEALRRKTQGERVPFETEDLLTSLTNITEPPPIAFTDPSDFDEVLREGDEYLGKIEEELGNEERKQILSRIEKGFAKTVRWETINFPLQQLMKYHLRLPFPHAPKVLSRNPKMWVDKTPILEHPAVLIAIPEWESKYGTKSYAVDVKEGYIYAVRNEDWERLVERAYVAIDEPLEISQITPVEKETLVGEVQTLNSKEKVPLAESTRKDFKEPIQKGKGPPGDPVISQNLDRSVDANVTIDTAGLEKTFREVGESMKEVFTSQQIFNRTMKDTLEASTKAQEKQTEALEKLNISTKQRDHDHMFAAIKPYDGKDSKEFDAWIEQIMTACKISGRNPRFVALAKSTGAVTEVILSMKPKVTWVEFVEELRRCFSESKTRVHAAAIYNEFRRQDDNENLRSYIHKYTRLHREATGKATDEEFDTHNKLHFLSRLRNSTIATKISQSREYLSNFSKFDRYSLKNCIEKALMLESRLQIREMVTIARENLENKEPKVMEMSEEGEEQQEELNILSEDKGPGRFRNPNLANSICYKCSSYGHYGRECPEANQAMEQLEDRIEGRIEHSFNAYTPVTLQYMNDMIVKAAKLEVSRKLAKKKLEKLKNQKGGDPQDKTQYPVGRGRGQPPRQGQQVGRPPLTPTAAPMPAQQTSQPITTRGRGRGGANMVIKRGGRQGTLPPKNPQQTTKKVTFQQPAQVKVKSEPEQAKVEPNPFLQPHLPEIHEMTEDLEETDLEKMSQEELDELQNQLDQELQAEFQEEVPEEVQ